jgi:predicted nucleic acid-binding protein
MDLPIRKQFAMNGIDYLADTNILLYILEQHPNVKDLSKHTFAVSFVSEIEMLGKKNIAQNEKDIIKKLLADCTIISFNENIKKETIKLKQKYNIKIPDAIIAATSIVSNIPLVTADKDFNKIKTLKVNMVDV